MAGVVVSLHHTHATMVLSQGYFTKTTLSIGRGVVGEGANALHISLCSA